MNENRMKPSAEERIREFGEVHGYVDEPEALERELEKAFADGRASMDERLEKQTAYSIQLQRLIEAFCRGDKLPFPLLHHHIKLSDCRASMAEEVQQAKDRCTDALHDLAVKHDEEVEKAKEAGYMDGRNYGEAKLREEVEKARAEEREAVDGLLARALLVLNEWLEAPFFETEGGWAAWVGELRPKVEAIIDDYRARGEGRTCICDPPEATGGVGRADSTCHIHGSKP